MWGPLIGFLAGIMATAIPTLYNLFGGGKEQSVNLASGAATAEGLVGLLTLLGIVMFIMGLASLRAKQMLGAFILIIFAPQIAAFLAPFVNASDVGGSNTTTTTTALPQQVTQQPMSKQTGNSYNYCIYDPVKYCYDEVAPYLADLANRVGSYTEENPAFNQPKIYVLIKTRCGYIWSGPTTPLGSIIVEGRENCPVERVYVYGYFQQSFLDELAKAFGLSASYSMKITVKKESWFLFQDTVYEKEDTLSIPMREARKVMLIYVINDKILKDIENELSPGEWYIMEIRAKFPSPFPGLPSHDSVVYLKTAKEYYTGSISEYYPGATSYNIQSIVPPEYDPLTGLNLQLLSIFISTTSLMVNLLMLKEMSKRVGRK